MKRDDGVLALVALGGNLPYRSLSSAGVLAAAAERLSALGEVEACSGWWRTAAWPDPARPAYLNRCVRLRTAVEPEALMAALLDLEADLGRTRGAPNADRTLDLDLVDYGGRVMSAAQRGASSPPAALILPHPRVLERAFVLFPLRDVAPTWRHPETGTSVDAALAALAPEARAGAARVADPGQGRQRG